MQVQRFHSPFSRWVSGLLFELVAIAGFLVAVAALVALVVRLV